MIQETQVTQALTTQLPSREGKKASFIIVPSQAILASEAFQRKLRENLIEVYRGKAQAYKKSSGLNYSSRKFQRFIEDTLYEYKGDIYICDDKGHLVKHRWPNLSHALGDDARTLRDFMARHRPRRDLYKLTVKAVFIGIVKPLFYAELMRIH